MKPFRRLIFLAVGLALGFWAWNNFFPNPQKVITNRLQKLAQWVSFSPGDGNFKRLANAEKMEALFAENIQVSVNVPGEENHTFEHRDELTQAVMGARSLINGVNVSFLDINVMVNPDKESATAEATLNARLGADKDLMVQPVKFTFKKTDDGWVIAKLETVKPLR